MLGNGGNYSVNMIIKLGDNADLDGLVTLNQSQLTLQDSATVKLIEATNIASVRVDSAD